MDDMESYLRWEAKQGSVEFERTAYHTARLKRKLDCGHWIDGSEPYRYMVWKVYGTDGLLQRTDCDFCMRKDHVY